MITLSVPVCQARPAGWCVAGPGSMTRSTRAFYQPIPAQVQVTLCLDRDVLAWFKAQGEGYQICINAALKAYKEAREKA